MSGNSLLYRALRRGTIFKALRGSEPFDRVEVSQPLEHHGSRYGGWSIVAGSLDADSVVVSVGIGEDVSFDLSLIARYGCRVHGFDPTPRALAWVEAKVDDPRFVMHPFALADHDGTLQLHLPPAGVADQVSASSVAAAGASGALSVPCLSLASALARTGHSRCDLLKMDIEGAEYAVIAQAAERGWLAGCGQLLVEFHHFLPGVGVEPTRRAVATLRALGLRIAWISRTNHEYLFVR